MSQDPSTQASGHANPYAQALAIPVEPSSGAREAMERALIEIMRETRRPAQEVSVTALCKRAHVARSTFYANYHHVDEVLQSVERRLLRRIIDEGAPVLSVGVDAAVESFSNVMRLVNEQEPLFRLFVVDVPNERFMHNWRMALCGHLWDRLFCENGLRGVRGELRAHSIAATVNRQLMVEMIAGLMMTFVTFRFEHPNDVSMAEIDILLPRFVQAMDEIW